MKLNVYQFPKGEGNLPIADCVEVADDAPTPSAPWVRMTIPEFYAWRDAHPYTPPAPTPSLQDALNAIFDALTPSQKVRLAYTKTVLDIQNEAGMDKALLKGILAAVNTDDDAALKAAQTQALALPQWNT